MPKLRLSDAELAALCPGLTQPAARLRRLHADGFARARLIDGQIVLERAHYEAVCRGEFDKPGRRADNLPQLRP